ncbi:MAG: hypothetical protein PHN59_06780 [Candidatus Omnitrophica bacterium]|nr:hypothetical protein [Candidatus Omnitrophota bacterium]
MPKKIWKMPKLYILTRDKFAEGVLVLCKKPEDIYYGGGSLAGPLSRFINCYVGTATKPSTTCSTCSNISAS